MIFPFITIENKYEAGSIGRADKQNIWNMKVALNDIVTLFWRVGRLEELNGQALGLSISHNWEIMKIYAHYLVVDPEKLKTERSPQAYVKIYRAVIVENVTINNGDNWKPY